MTQLVGESRPTGSSSTPPGPPHGPPPLSPSLSPLPTGRPRVRRALGRGWPLAVMLLGWPLWWVLGLAETVPLLVAVVMAVQLARGREVHLPRGFGWWALFLLWVALGATMLWVDAPGAVPGGGGGSRLMVFGFRFAWYLACTVALVWITTMPRREVGDRLVHGSVAAMFAISTLGGLLALAAPTLELRSLVELLLPQSLSSNGFVRSLVHVQVADLQTVLGRQEARPKAPFAYTNTWGSVMALSLVFVGGWLARTRRRARTRWTLVALVTVALAVPPILYSLNRGLWGALALGGLGLAVLAAAKGRPALLLACGVLAGVGLLVVLATPLGDLVAERLDNQHSNDRRGELLTLTTRSVSEGSPVLGFGSTRDVQGSFASITGGATPDCPGCGVPPLGTQGQLWTVLFSQGWPGLVFFLLFLVLALARSVRCRSVNEAVCTFAAGFFLLQLPVYDTLGLPLFVLMLAIGLVAREHRELGGAGPPRALTTLGRLGAEVRRGAPAILALAAVGGVAGLAVVQAGPAPAHTSKVFMAITPAPVYLDTGVTVEEEDGEERATKEITVDTEAALMLSETTLAQAAESVETTPYRLRQGLAVTGEPNTSVLVLHFSWPDADEIPGLATAVTDAYFDARREYLERRREDLVAQLREQLRTLDGSTALSRSTRGELIAAIDELEQARGEVGEVIRTGPPVPGRRALELHAMSGAALGLLAGVAATTLVAPSRRRRRTRATATATMAP